MLLFSALAALMLGAASPAPAGKLSVFHLHDNGSVCTWLKGPLDGNGTAVLKVYGAPCDTMFVSVHPSGLQVLMAAPKSAQVWLGDLARHRVDKLPDLPEGFAVAVGYVGEAVHVLTGTNLTLENAARLGHKELLPRPQDNLDNSRGIGYMLYTDFAYADHAWHAKNTLVTNTEACEQPDYRSMPVFKSMQTLEAQQACPVVPTAKVSKQARAKIDAACNEGPWNYAWMEDTAQCQRPGEARLFQGPSGYLFALCGCYFDGLDEYVRRDIGSALAVRQDGTGTRVMLLDNATFDPYDPSTTLLCRGTDVLVSRRRNGPYRDAQTLGGVLWHMPDKGAPVVQDTYRGRVFFVPEVRPEPSPTP